MSATRAWMIIPLVLLFAACPGEEQEAPDATVVDLPGTTPATPSAAPMTGADAGTTVQLQQLQGSGLSGEATITGMGNQTQVMVRLSGGAANGSHPGHIHSGTCQNIGAVVQALQPVATDAGGTGSVTATADLAPMTAMDGQHIIVYHQPGGAPAACAEIPRHNM